MHARGIEHGEAQQSVGDESGHDQATEDIGTRRGLVGRPRSRQKKFGGESCGHGQERDQDEMEEDVSRVAQRGEDEEASLDPARRNGHPLDVLR